MPKLPATFARNPRPAQRLVLLACTCSVFCGGCFTAKRPASVMSHVALAHPVVPAAVDVALENAPEIMVEEEPAPRLALSPAGPARPHVAAVRAPGPVGPEKPADPLIAPELSDEQLSAAKLATQQSLIVAQRNLKLAEGKTLNAAQQDLISKIQSFLDSAREAVKNNDWPRARTQSRKAEVLSQEIFPAP
jgi:hypothetical protein